MPKYVIEREIPDAGKLSAQDLRAISQTSCGVLKALGPDIQWVQSFVTDDKVYCVYIAPNQELVRTHAQQGGFPANRISEVRSVIDPPPPKRSGVRDNRAIPGPGRRIPRPQPERMSTPPKRM